MKIKEFIGHWIVCTFMVGLIGALLYLIGVFIASVWHGPNSYVWYLLGVMLVLGLAGALLGLDE